MKRDPIYLTETDLFGAPERPTDRPRTRKEIWDYYTYIYRRFNKSPEWLRDFCRADWVGEYAYWYSIYGWRKQPDWKEGDPVIPAAVPTNLFHDQPRTQIIYDCLAKAERTTA